MYIGKRFIVLALVVSAFLVWPHRFISVARASIDTLEYYIDTAGNKLSKIQASRTLLMDKGARVWKCAEVEMSEKMTLVRKKK